MNHPSILTSRRLVLLICLCMPALHATIIPTPVWFGEPDTTYQSYIFSTSSTTPDPEVLSNPYGDPQMLITYVPYIGVGVGYMDPDNPLHIHREGGAWDLGPDGSISVDVPIAPPVGGGPGYIVEVYVSVVYEPTAGFYNIPDIILTPGAMVSTITNPTFEQDGFFWWGLLTGTATIDAVPGNWINVLIDATGDTGSLVDTVEIHTRYQIIPEPGSLAFGLGLGCLLLITGRRLLRRRPDPAA